jgi:hypothetical protein
MLKLLLLLAAVAALAVAAPLAAPDFNDLDASDNDASDNDASDLDDIDADDLEILDEPKKYNPESLDARADSEEKARVCEDIVVSGVTCPNDRYISIARNGRPICRRCPEPQTVPYGDFEACGDGLCVSCPFKIDTKSKICVTSFQENILKGAESLPQAVDGVVNLSQKTQEEASKQFSEPGFVLRGEDTKVLVTNLQTTSCATGLTCCMPGFYGASSSSCTECPSNKPSSPYSAPNVNCQCPNSGSNKCFACNNKCRPYDSQSRMCLPYQCPTGQTCKTVNNEATCV